MKTNKSQTEKRLPIISRAREQRLTAILECIALGNYPNATDLGKMFEVKRKVIRKDVDVLNTRYHQNIEFDYRMNGYYCLTKPTPLPTCHTVTEEEIIALHLLKNVAELLKDLPHSDAVKSLLDKLIATLSKSVDLPKGWQNIISFHTTARCLFKPEIFETIFKAGLHRERAEMLYCKQGPGQRPEKRIIEPHHMATVNNECFVFAFDVASQKMRTFIPARMEEVKSTGKRFKRKKFSIEERLKHSFHIFTGDELHDVLIEFTPQVADLIREKKWGGQEGLRELENGGVELHLKLSSLVEVLWWILRFTGDAVVISPPQLEEMVIAAARRILAEYEKRRAMRAASGKSMPSDPLSSPSP